MHGFNVGQVIQIKNNGDRLSVKVENRAYKTDGELLGIGLVVRLNGKAVESAKRIQFEESDMVGYEPQDAA